MLTLTSRKGQNSMNFYKNASATVVDDLVVPNLPEGVPNIPQMQKQSLQQSFFGKHIPQSAGQTALFNCGAFDVDGKQNEVPNFPFSVRYDPNPLKSLYCEYV